VKTNELIAKIIKKDAIKMVEQWPPCMTIITHQPKRPILHNGRMFDLSCSGTATQQTKKH
jgi:hypothetical protein